MDTTTNGNIAGLGVLGGTLSVGLASRFTQQVVLSDVEPTLAAARAQESHVTDLRAAAAEHAAAATAADAQRGAIRLNTREAHDAYKAAFHVVAEHLDQARGLGIQADRAAADATALFDRSTQMRTTAGRLDWVARKSLPVAFVGTVATVLIMNRDAWLHADAH